MPEQLEENACSFRLQNLAAAEVFKVQLAFGLDGRSPMGQSQSSTEPCHATTARRVCSAWARAVLSHRSSCFSLTLSTSWRALSAMRRTTSNV